MKKRVLHFVRKKNQLKASFVLNQIVSHIDFEPYIVFRKSNSGRTTETFADFNLEKYNFLDLSKDETFFEKIKFKSVKALSIAQVEKILDFIKENNIDICHFHYGTDCGIYYPLTKKLKIPFVVSFYGYDCSSFPSFLFGFGKLFLKHRVFNHCKMVLAMSADMKKDLINIGCPEEKILIHYHGIDCSIFYKERSYREKEKITLLNISTLVPQKGHLFLLKTIKRLIVSGVSNFELRLVGSGELENELRLFVLENKLEKLVTFVGPVKYASEQMMEEYTKADVFVHPSVIAPNGDKEGIPGTIIEAMSTGIPVISTYHAGIPYIIDSGVTGILVKEHDEEALALAICSLIQNKQKRLAIGMAGQNYAVTNLDLRSKEKELEELYMKILKR